MSEAKQMALALFATLFALTFIVLIVLYGGHTARSCALIAAFSGVVSQFAAQDITAQRQSLIASYLGFAMSAAALAAFIFGY